MIQIEIMQKNIYYKAPMLKIYLKLWYTNQIMLFNKMNFIHYLILHHRYTCCDLTGDILPTDVRTECDVSMLSDRYSSHHLRTVAEARQRKLRGHYHPILHQVLWRHSDQLCPDHHQPRVHRQRRVPLHRYQPSGARRQRKQGQPAGAWK